MKAVLFGLFGAALAGGLVDDDAREARYLGLSEDIVAAATSIPDAQRELGRRLFFDAALSIDRSVSCSSCHRPEHGFADDVPFSSGVAGALTRRNTPTISNRALGQSFMWDGRAATLEEQVLQPIENPREMGLPLDRAIARLRADDDYSRVFQEAFGEAPNRDLLARALAAFVRSNLQAGSRVDRFRAGDRTALSPEERSGLWFFESRGGCWRCHSGVNFTDEEFHNTGVGQADPVADRGRFDVTRIDSDAGAFKTPTLRGVLATAPYMHDGSLATLGDVVEFYRQGGIPNGNLDPVMGPIEMSERDAANLVAFLKALSRP